MRTTAITDSGPAWSVLAVVPSRQRRATNALRNQKSSSPRSSSQWQDAGTPQAETRAERLPFASSGLLADVLLDQLNQLVRFEGLAEVVRRAHLRALLMAASMLTSREDHHGDARGVGVPL